MGDKKQAKNSKATLKILQEKAKEKYIEQLKVRDGETITQWEERTSKYRMRYEKEFKSLDVRIKKSKRKYKLAINKAKYNNRKSMQNYDKMNRVIYHISRREFKFFQNAMIILSWAEIKYNISKEKFLIFMYLYAEERPMTDEEIIYKLNIYRNKSSNKTFRLMVKEGHLRPVRHTTEQRTLLDTNLYVLSSKIAEIIRYLHGAMVGTRSLDSFKGLRKDHSHIDDMFDKIKNEIIEYKTGEIMKESINERKIED